MGSVVIESKGERTRGAIIAAASAIFAERGYSGASLNDIIESAGVTKGGLYFHFESKLELALAVIRDQQDRWTAEAMAEAKRHPRAVDRLFALPRELARLASEGRGPWALRRLVDELAADPALRPQVCGSIDVPLAIVADQFREAQAEGSIRPDVDPDRLANVAVGGFVGMQTITEQLGDGELERRVDDLIHVVQLAVVGRP